MVIAYEIKVKNYGALTPARQGMSICPCPYLHEHVNFIVSCLSGIIYYVHALCYIDVWSILLYVLVFTGADPRRQLMMTAPGKGIILQPTQS